ncbi:Zinc finger CCCH-type with G patch domain-containing protein [Nibea albiflora]|uniref:Zinc finger CCCH-type with G patch domain-containing protein n=1 Tax=Nibea albiflora TaxID=240163 RepID=A0ACB7EM32_NIBAL|nr:Zinc finger CCCH-type with G patch domain-containing protein [Nibea albiflora]
MDEETLEAAISTYGAQLQQVETALSAGLDPAQQSDLLKLKEDLCQLIELTEASLVSVKKSLLLASLEDSSGTAKSMKPCPFYLEDKCRFPDNCRFSHGEVVYVSELREFLESDLSNLEEGSSCLARQEDGIWYPAKIKEIDSGYYTVKFDSLLQKDVVVEADCIIPPLREDDALSSDSDLDDTGDGDDMGYAKVLDSEESTVTSNSANFGGWEAHTRGIGSKLMLKMGYEYGKGLGKMQEGRVEPVMAVVLPKGKSLDQCAELTQRRTQSKAAKDGSKSTDPAEGGAAAPSATGVEAYRGGKGTKRSLNVKLFQAAERVSQTEREIQKLSESLSRQTGRDASRVKQLEEKLSAARRLLAQQKAQELSIQSEHRKADTHKKMTEF